MRNRYFYSTLSWQKIFLLLIIGNLFWLPIEDQTIIVPMLLALPIGGMVAYLGFQRFQLNLLLSGLAGGLTIAPLTLFWMAFKTGVHGHGAADFTSTQIVDVLKSAPLWTLAGSLLGWSWQRFRAHHAAHKLNHDD